MAAWGAFIQSIDMATLKEIQDKVDPILAALATKIDTRQVAYSSARGGRYFQGLWTSSGNIKDGVDTAPNRLSGKPTDQTESWNDFLQAGDLPSTLPCRLECNVYRNGSGWGYYLAVEIETQSGDVYRRSRNMRGSDSAHTVAWRKLVAKG